MDTAVTVAAGIQAAGSSSAVQKSLLFVFLVGLVWFIITLLIMLALARKGHKKRQILTVFVVMQVLFLALLLAGVFFAGWVAGLIAV